MVAIGIVGMAQVSARAWFGLGAMPKEKAVDVISAFAWRGLHGFVSDSAKFDAARSDAARSTAGSESEPESHTG